MKLNVSRGVAITGCSPSYFQEENYMERSETIGKLSEALAT